MTDARRQTCLHLKLATLPKIWWTWPGSNRRPLPCHGSALPAAPQAHSCGKADARKAGISSIFYHPHGLVKLPRCVLPIDEPQYWQRNVLNALLTARTNAAEAHSSRCEVAGDVQHQLRQSGGIGVDVAVAGGHKGHV